MKYIVNIYEYLSGRSHFNLHLSSVQKLIQLILGLCHAFLLVLFYIYSIHIMIIVNILSIITYTIAYYISKHGYILTFFEIVYYEITIHLILVYICVGSKCGFELYCIAMVPISYYCKYTLSQHNNTLADRFNPFIHSVFSIIVYILLQIYCFYHSPLYTFGTEMLQHRIYDINLILVTATIIAFMSTFITQALRLESKLKAQNNKLEKLSYTDSLTGLYNRRSIDEYFNACISDNKEFAVIMSDIDDFKKINDIYGHEFGDSVLELVADIFNKNTRADDIVCRWGGEEILALLPNSNIKTACSIAESIRSAINESRLTNRGQTIRFTMTFGIAHSNQAKSTDDIIHLADKRLYHGKKIGKNCIVHTNSR